MAFFTDDITFHPPGDVDRRIVDNRYGRYRRRFHFEKHGKLLTIAIASLRRPDFIFDLVDMFLLFFVIVQISREQTLSETIQKSGHISLMAIFDHSGLPYENSTKKEFHPIVPNRNMRHACNLSRSQVARWYVSWDRDTHKITVKDQANRDEIGVITGCRHISD